MKLDFKTQNLNQLLKQRNFAGLLVGGLLLSNLFLSLKLLKYDEQWILIPEFDTDHRVALSASTYSDQYLIDWASSLTSDLLTVNPATVKQKTKRFLEVTGSSHGNFEKVLKKKAQTLIKEGISTVFYPKVFKVQRSAQKVLVEGTFMTFFGQDKKPIIEKKVFSIEYKRGPKGVILVEEFKEEKK